MRLFWVRDGAVDEPQGFLPKGSSESKPLSRCDVHPKRVDQSGPNWALGFENSPARAEARIVYKVALPEKQTFTPGTRNLQILTQSGRSFSEGIVAPMLSRPDGGKGIEAVGTRVRAGVALAICGHRFGVDGERAVDRRPARRVLVE